MAGEAVGINLPTSLLNPASVTARNAEYTGTPLTDTGLGTAASPYLGCNRAGSNTPGIGIGTGIVKYLIGEPEDPATWTLLDQDGATRIPQLSMHIAGDALGDGDSTETEILAVDYGTGDFNDQVSFVLADTQAAPGAVMEALSGTVNRTNRTVEIGETAWGTIPVA